MDQDHENEITLGKMDISQKKLMSIASICAHHTCALFDKSIPWLHILQLSADHPTKFIVLHSKQQFLLVRKQRASYSFKQGAHVYVTAMSPLSLHVKQSC
jgi:hypothetical protein